MRSGKYSGMECLGMAPGGTKEQGRERQEGERNQRMQGEQTRRTQNKGGKIRR